VAKRYNELGNKEKESIKSSATCDLYKIIESEWDDSVSNKSSLREREFGMCVSCKHMCYVKSEFSVVYASCSLYDVRLKEGRPIIECTGYDRKGNLTLNQMWDIAYVLELEKDRVAGFILDDSDNYDDPYP